MSTHSHSALSSALALCCLMAASTAQATPLQDRSPVTVSAAGRSGNLYLYFQAIVDPTAKPNPTVKSGQVLVAGKKVPGELLELSCVGGTELTKPFQASPYGKGTEGMIIEMNCGATHQFLFLLLPSSNTATPMRCNAGEQIIGTPAKATAASFGHQAFCMEDWSDVPIPKERLLDAARK